QVTNLTYKPEDLTREAFYGNLVAKGVKVEDMAKIVAGDKPESLPQDLNQLVKLAEEKFGSKVTQDEVGRQLKEHWRIAPPESCAACHR
ncbi:MAG: cytochrome C, partial [Verrucomicrobiaceae bacterium]